MPCGNDRRTGHWIRTSAQGTSLSDPRQPHVQAWSAYWSSGALHSCATSFAGNYAGAIATFWRGVFADLPQAARMLDLATGNGALPQLALAQVSDPEFRVHAVDLAALAPAWSAQAADRLRFHPGVALESLPFGDGSFDLVASQYGIEYARWPDALREALRVCDAHGVVACVVHHAGSALVRVGHREAGNLSLLLREDGLLSAARDAIPWAARAGAHAGGDAMSAARQAYNLAIAAIAEALEDNAVPDLLLSTRHQVHSLVAAVRNGTVAPDRALAMLANFHDDLVLSHIRTSDMLASARDRDGIESMAACIQQLRPEHCANIIELRQEQGVLGWGVVLAPQPRC